MFPKMQEVIMSDVYDQVKSIIVDVLKVDENEIEMDTRFIEDLKADSMDQFFLIDGFSEKFNLEIPDENAREIKSVGDAVNYIENHLN
jgi:acyl carrier protein